MTQEQKQLLLKDLCARVPYGVIADFKFGQLTRMKQVVEGYWLDKINDESFKFIKPYLRPLSSMTDEEINEFILISDTVLWLGNKMSTCILSLEQMDWLNKNMFDYRGLIEKGLALEAPEGMYKNE